MNYKHSDSRCEDDGIFCPTTRRITPVVPMESPIRVVILSVLLVIDY